MRRCRPLLGTFVEIEADRAEPVEAGFAAVARIHSLMSAHEPDSDLGRVNRFAHRQPVELNAETWKVLVRALRWWRMSGGLFDVVRAGARSFADGRIPRHPGQPYPEETDSSAVVLEGRSVRLIVPACLDLGGIAKGYAVDQAVAAMRRAGAARGLVNAGGDLSGFGPEPWPVSVFDPVTRRPAVDMAISDEAIATSALVGGSGAHLPPSAAWTSVTVRARSACDADALTKIVWAAPPGIGDLLDQAGACAFGIRVDGDVEEIGNRALAA